MKIFVTYSTPYYFKARNFAGKMAKWFGGFDKVVLYSPDDIDAEFKHVHDDIFSIKKGAGLWLWKPYSIYKALIEEANEGDYVFYCDAASFFIRNSDNLIKTMTNDDIWVSDNNFVEEKYTKEDAFQLLNCSDEYFRKTNQIQAQIIGIRKSPRSMAFVEEWLKLSSDFDVIGPENTKLGSSNCEGFIGHRYDQSILSLLSKKYKVIPHFSPIASSPTKYKPFYRNGQPIINREYPCCIVLQHSATIDKKKSIILALKAYLPYSIRKFIDKIKYSWRGCSI